jgi:hypothetical protein
VPVSDALKAVAVPLPLREFVDDAEGELEFRGDAEGAFDAEAPVDMDEEAVGGALSSNDVVAHTLLLAALLALAQPEAAKDALAEGDREGVAAAEAVAFPLAVACPLPLMVLLPLAQLVAAALADAVEDWLLHPVGDTVGLAGREGLSDAELEGVALTHAVPLGHREGVVVALRHMVDEGVPDGHAAPLGGAEMLAEGVGGAEGPPLRVACGEGELLAQTLCDSVPSGVAEAHGEGVGSPVGDVEPQPVIDADTLRVGPPDELPLGE